MPKVVKFPSHLTKSKKKRREPTIYPTANILREVLFGKDKEMADSTSQDEMREKTSPVQKKEGDS